MNPVRLIRMQKRMVEIEKELADLRKKIEDEDLNLADRNILVGLIRNLIGQKARLEVAMGEKATHNWVYQTPNRKAKWSHGVAVGGKSKTFEQFLEELRQDELRREKEKPPSEELEEMMRYEMSPERVAARTKEFEDHGKGVTNE